MRRSVLRDLVTGGAVVAGIQAFTKPVEASTLVPIHASWYGCVPDTGADMAGPILKALTGAAAVYGSELIFEPGVYLVGSQVQMPSAITNVIMRSSRVAIFRYTGAVDNTKAVWRLSITTASGVGRLIFSGLQFDADTKAGYGLIIEGAGGGSPQFNNNTFYQCAFQNGILDGLLLGDPAGTQDLGVNTNLWEQCSFPNNDRYGVRCNGTNWYNNKFSLSAFQFNAGNSPINHVFLEKASAATFDKCDFTLLTNADGNTCCVRSYSATAAATGGLSLLDCYSEEFRILRLETEDRSQQNCVIQNMYVNDGTAAAKRYSIYAPAGTLTIRDSFLATGNADSGVGVYIGNRAVLENVNIGAAGRIEMDHPERCVIEGVAQGSFEALNQNWNFSFWRQVNGAGTDDALYSWSKIAAVGPAVYNLKQVANIGYGQFSAKIDVTTAGGGNNAGLRYSTSRKIGPITIIVKGVAQFTDLNLGFTVNGVPISPDVYIDPTTLVFYAHAIYDGSAQAIGQMNIDIYALDNSHGAVAFSYTIASIILIDKTFPAGLATGIVKASQDILPTIIFGGVGGAAAPSVGAGSYYEAGSIIWNAGAAIGAQIGWKCTVSGTPGTWVAMNGRGTFTCANAAATTVNDATAAALITATSVISLMPTNAAAATLMGAATSLYVSARTAGTSFVVTTANAAAAAGTETFEYEIIN